MTTLLHITFVRLCFIG